MAVDGTPVVVGAEAGLTREGFRGGVPPVDSRSLAANPDPSTATGPSAVLALVLLLLWLLIRAD